MFRGILYFLVIIYIIYAIIYNIYPKEHSIIQVPIQHFTFNLLYDRSPIVIEQPVYNLDDVLSKWFCYNFISDQTKDNCDIRNRWYENRGKFLVVQNKNMKGERMELVLNSPHNTHPVPNEKDVLYSILLDPEQIAIIPMGWGVILNEEDRVVRVDDVITYLWMW